MSCIPPPAEAPHPHQPPADPRGHSDPSLPQGDALLCAPLVSHLCCILWPGLFLGVGWAWVLRQAGAGRPHCRRESFPAHTWVPLRLLLLTAALALGLSQNPLFPERASHKEPETPASTTQTCASFVKLCRELPPFCENSVSKYLQSEVRLILDTTSQPAPVDLRSSHENLTLTSQVVRELALTTVYSS